MKIINPLEMNDWPISKFIKIILVAQFLIWGLLGLDDIGLHIPMLRQIVGFIYLSFIPGVLALRVLNIHKIGSTKSLLFSIGLSLSILMFTGLFINFLLPLLGISTPFSHNCLIICINVVVLLLAIACYSFDKDYCDPSFIDIKEILSPSLLILILIPFLSIFGTYLVNYYHSNVILIFMIFIISMVSLITLFSSFIPPKYYPLAIWVMGLSLIWHRTLISQYIGICDDVGEYYFANLVINNSFWNYALLNNYNSMLSIVTLAPIYYHICNLDLTWIFKIIYPLLYSFVSVEAYVLFLTVFKSSKIAFMSSFLIISTNAFYTLIPLIAKQSIAEIFMLLVIILVISRKDIYIFQKSILLTIFSISLVVSHYTTSYFFISTLAFIYLFSLVFHNRYEESPNINIKFSFVVLVFTIAMAWSIYVSESSCFSSTVYTFKHTIYNVLYDLFSTSSRSYYILFAKSHASIFNIILKYMHMCIFALISIGVLKVLYSETDLFKISCNSSVSIKNHINEQSLKMLDSNIVVQNNLFLRFAIYFLMLLTFSIFNSSLSVISPSRLYLLSLFILAPFSFIGYFTLVSPLSKKFYNFNTNNVNNLFFQLFSIFLIVLMLLECGFLSEVTGDTTRTSISISQEYMKNGNLDSKASFYAPLIATQNIFSGKWLAEYMKPKTIIYRGDWEEGYPTLTIYGGVNQEPFSLYISDGTYLKSYTNTTSNITQGYIQLSYANLIGKIGDKWDNKLQIMEVYDFKDVQHLFTDKNKVYNNGGSEILWKG
jgi:uncharacterized membrane protein